MSQGLKTPALLFAGLKAPLLASSLTYFSGVFNPATRETGTFSPWRQPKRAFFSYSELRSDNKTRIVFLATRVLHFLI